MRQSITMGDVMALLGYSRPSRGRDNMCIPCPKCDRENTQNPHLNVNFSKACFRCPRCGNSGGMFALYSQFTGIEESSAREAIYERLGVPSSVEKAEREVWMSFQKEVAELPIESPLVDADSRHKSYLMLLSKLSLAPDHRENLRQRGLPDDVIDALGYKSTPLFGTKQLSESLLMEGCYLNGVPGFFRAKDGAWDVNLRPYMRGILIPVRDENGLIQGIQIRADNTKKGKFRWMSSSGLDDGCAAQAFSHYSGPVSEAVYLTEGPMKADIIRYFTGCSVIAVPGVMSLSHLDAMLDRLIPQGLKRVVTAFDMDMLSNYHVQQAFENLKQLLERHNLWYVTALWDPSFKGLDDYTWHLAQRHRDQNL